jgi:general secretion pathway protein J
MRRRVRFPSFNALSGFTPLEIMPRCSLRARLRPGRAHAPEGGPLSEPASGSESTPARREAPLSRRLGRRLQRGFRIIPGAAPEGVPPRRAGFIPFRDKSLTGFSAPLKFLTGFTLIEVVVTLTILGFILVIISGAFRLGISAWDRGESIKEEYQKIRIISQLVTRQVKSIVPYKIQTKKAEGDYLAFEGKAQSLRFVSALPVKTHQPEGFVYTIYQFKESDQNGGRLILYEQRVLNRDLLEEEPKEGIGIPLIEGVSRILFEYYQEEDLSKNQTEAWLEEWSAKEKKELPKCLKMTVNFKDSKGKDPSFVLILPISAFQFEEIRTRPITRRAIPERLQ